MKLAVFSANLPRHVACVNALASQHEVTAIIEPKSWLPGEVSPVFHAYWQRVQAAELALFGVPLLRAPCVVIPRGEINRLTPLVLPHVRAADRVVVFSASYLTGDLVAALLERGALNLHVGIAPEYRGSAPNMYAYLDGNEHLIGAQVQRLSKGLDAGDILAEVRVPVNGTDYFTRGMRAVQLGIEAVVDLLTRPPSEWRPVRPNDRSQQLRYSRHAEFDEKVAAAILAKTDGR